MRNNNRRNSLLWHAMEEGTVSAQQLSGLTGWTTLTARTALVKGVAAGLMARALPKAHPATYGLTHLGIAEAQKVEPGQVDFASQEYAQAAIAEFLTGEPAARAAAAETDVRPVFDQLCEAVAFKPEPTEPAPMPGAIPQSFGWTASNDVPKVFEAEDVVCAINSKGELVIDLGGANNIVVQFPPKQALVLQSFLDNTSLLYELSAKGQL